MTRDPNDIAAARMFDKVVQQLDRLLANDPADEGLITAGEVRAVRRLVAARQEMVEQGLHHGDEPNAGQRARYSDDTRAAAPPSQGAE